MIYGALNEQQTQLCRDCGIDPEGMGVDCEDEKFLRLHHFTSGNEVVIWKGLAQLRREKENGYQ